jgi:lipopolysaccharide transport system ATP-binding protein
MQMRIAFAVATAVRPDLLIVDEALSVGDAYFQHKSFARIRAYREQGTALLIVSHDPGAVKQLCDRALLLEDGRLLRDGRPDEVLDFYNALIAERENSQIEVTRADDGRARTVSGTGEAVVESLALCDPAGMPLAVVPVGAEVELRVRVRVNASVPRLVLGYMLKDRLGQVAFGTNTHHTGQAVGPLSAGDVVDYRVCFPMNLGAGTYSVSTALVSNDAHLERNYEWRDLALLFTVANVGQPTFVGGAWIPPRIVLEAP